MLSKVLTFDKRLLAFARHLHSIEDFDGMVQATAREIQEATGYNTTWLAIFDLPNHEVRILAAKGALEDDIWAHAPVFPIAGDPYMLRCLNATEPQIVADAQVDSGVNKEVVKQLGNRTLISVPMRLIDQPFGALAAGTFGDEGPRLPSEAELAHFVGIAGQLVNTAARLILNREREVAREQAAKSASRLLQRQRLESLGELAGGVAHDFNNLLTVIIAGISLLMEDETDPVRHDDLIHIQGAAERAAELTRRLLALGQRQSLQLCPAAINTLVEFSIGMIRRVIPTGIKITTKLAPGLPALHIDVGQIEQVLMNLCLNARDAMGESGVLTIETQSLSLNDDFVHYHPWAKVGQYILLTVTDTGSGISPDVLVRIFEPFFTTKVSKGGSGLGLAVSRGIIEQHGGLLHVYSEANIGTTFKIYLPSAHNQETIEVATEALSPVVGGSERILVADDEVQVCRIVARMLTRAGYDVVTVADGAAAVDCVSSEQFDLVLLDAVMPQMGGRAAFDSIRALYPNIKIVFASGYGGEELTARFLADTGVPLVSKPFDPQTLLRVIRAQLDT